MAEFIEADALGGWSIVVKLNGMTVGHIRRMGDASGFGYFRGENNHLTPAFQDGNLDLLKEKVDADVRAL